MSQSPSLVILAAGMGSRYGGLKQVDPVGPNGEIVIDYSIYDALQAGFNKLVFVIRRDIEDAFRSTIGGKFEGKADVHYAFQELDNLPDGFSVPADRAKPWGTGHAVLAAKDIIKEPFAVINADDYYGRCGYQLLHDHFDQNSDDDVYALVGFALRNTLSDHGSVARGICSVDEDSYLKSVVERTSITRHGDGAIFEEPDGTKEILIGDEWVSMNMWGFSAALMPHLEEGFEQFLRERGTELKSEYFLPARIDALIKSHRARVRVLPSSDTWFGVTYQEDRPHVAGSISKLVDQGLYPSPLWD
jgi:hypothetical protein